jgi:hypothetical protein
VEFGVHRIGEGGKSGLGNGKFFHCCVILDVIVFK